MLNVADVFVETRVNRHVFGSHGESFTMLVLVLDVKNERDAGRVSAHHLLHEVHRQVDALDHK